MDKLNSAVKKLIQACRKAGSTVTLSQINAILPEDAATPEQIESVMGQIEEAGIEIVEEKRGGAAGKGRHCQCVRKIEGPGAEYLLCPAPTKCGECAGIGEATPCGRRSRHGCASRWRALPS